MADSTNIFDGKLCVEKLEELKIKLPYGGYVIPYEKQNFPFIFTTKNYALSQYGTTATFNDYGQNAEEDEGHPPSNLIDGNRSSFFQASKVSPFNQDWASVFFDMSSSLNGADDDINIICLESDTMFPCNAIRVSSYWDSDYSEGEIIHQTSYEQILAGFNKYAWGINPKVDTISSIAGRFDGERMIMGGDGRFMFIFLRNSLDSDRPYVRIDFCMPGRNLFGPFGTFTYGLWDDPVDEVLKGSGDDPVPYHTTATSFHEMVYGLDDNYIEIAGTNKETRQLYFGLREDHEYILSWYHKAAFAAFPGIYYDLKIEYFNYAWVSLGTESLYSNGLGVPAWNYEKTCINTLRYGAGRRQSGINFSAASYGTQVHDVPVGARGFSLQWTCNHSSAKWQIDDIILYSLNNNFPTHELTFETLNGPFVLLEFPKRYDYDGILKVKRVGLYGYRTSTSLASGTPAHLQDLGGSAGPNPAGVSYTYSGKAFQRNFRGNVKSQFIPKTGVKQQRAFEVIASKEYRLFIDDLYGRQEPFGMLEPQGEFGDYVIVEGSLRWRAIASPSLNDPANYYWQGTFVLAEV
jgi:hypothetical protein